VILASEALRIGSEYTEVSTCQSVRGGQTLMLRFPFRTERLRFPTADLAMVVETRIDDIVKRHRARSTTLAVGEDEQFVRCTYLGGAHLPLEPTARYDLLFRNDQLEIFASPARSDHTPRCVIPMDAILSLNLSGLPRVWLNRGRPEDTMAFGSDGVMGGLECLVRRGPRWLVWALIVCELRRPVCRWFVHGCPERGQGRVWDLDETTRGAIEVEGDEEQERDQTGCQQ